jgi:hypothetical protein
MGCKSFKWALKPVQNSILMSRKKRENEKKKKEKIQG